MARLLIDTLKTECFTVKCATPKSLETMKLPTLKKFNYAMAMQWIIFLPVILPLCLVFGALQGVVNMFGTMAQRMMLDIES